MARLRDVYKSKIISGLTEKFGYKNVMAVPKVEKVVISMGIGKALQDKKFLDIAKADLITLSGQMPVICKSKKSGRRKRKDNHERSRPGRRQLGQRRKLSMTSLSIIVNQGARRMTRHSLINSTGTERCTRNG